MRKFFAEEWAFRFIVKRYWSKPNKGFKLNGAPQMMFACFFMPILAWAFIITVIESFIGHSVFSYLFSLPFLFPFAWLGAVLFVLAEKLIMVSNATHFNHRFTIDYSTRQICKFDVWFKRNIRHWDNYKIWKSCTGYTRDHPAIRTAYNNLYAQLIFS